jgi:hypothetical protein
MFSLFLPNRIHIRRTYINSSGQSVVVPIIYTDINYGGCKTFAGSGSVIPCGQNGPTPRAIVCNGSATNLIVTEYTIVHELGHIFDNRSQGANGQPGVSVAMGLTGFVQPITDCTISPGPFRVFGEFATQVANYSWTRGEGGWGSGPSLRPTQGTPVPAQIPTPTPQPLITNFQQNARFDFGAKTNEEIYEAAADMFLNWVYRAISDPTYPPPAFINACAVPLPTPNPTPMWNGFQNREWRGQISSSATAGNLDAGLSGNGRYYWMHTTILQLFASRPQW